MKSRTHLACVGLLTALSACSEGAQEPGSRGEAIAPGPSGTTADSPVGSGTTPTGGEPAVGSPGGTSPTSAGPTQTPPTAGSPASNTPTSPTLPSSGSPSDPVTEPDPNPQGTAVDPSPTTPAVTPTTPAVPGPSPEPSTEPDPTGPTTPDDDVVDVGAHENFSFFVTSYHHIRELSGSDDGFGGDLRYNGAATGLEGADAICQEMARRVSFGHRTWRAYLSTSTVNAIDRIGEGPWYDFIGELVAEDTAGLLVSKTERGGFGGGGFGGGGLGAGGGGGLGLEGGCVEGDTDRPAGGAADCGTYDELGLFHDGSTDQNNDGINDDDHDTMTATLADGTYAGFSCDDWTSTTAMPEGGGGGLEGGIMMGHSWPAGSGQHWSESHGGHACKAGTNFIQDGFGDAATVGGGGGYGGFYCFAAD